MIIAAMATMPERLDILEKTVASLRPQVDVIRVYLNNFNEVPPFLNPEEGLLSQKASGDGTFIITPKTFTPLYILLKK